MELNFFNYKNEMLPFNPKKGNWYIFKIKKLTNDEFIIEKIKKSKKSKKLLRIKMVRIGS